MRCEGGARECGWVVRGAGREGGGSRGVGSVWRCDARSPSSRLRSASVCSRECMKERWAEHKAVCRKRQAVRVGTEWARGQNRALQLSDAAMERSDLLARGHLVGDQPIPSRSFPAATASRRAGALQ